MPTASGETGRLEWVGRRRGRLGMKWSRRIRAGESSEGDHGRAVENVVAREDQTGEGVEEGSVGECEGAAESAKRGTG